MFGNLKKAFVKRPLTIVDDAMANDYKIINANLSSLLEREKLNMFAMSGITQNDNKSEVAINIAIMYAKDGKKVLYVNCDSTSEYPAVAIDGLTIMDGNAQKDLVATLRAQQSQFDYIIVNLENISENVDSINVAKEVGGLVFVINKLLSKKKHLTEILSNFSHVSVKVLGTVFVNVH